MGEPKPPLSPRAQQSDARVRCAAVDCRAPRDRALSARLVLLLPVLGLALNTFGFRRVHRWLGRRAIPTSRGARAGARSAADLAALVVHVNRHLLPYQSRCLLESVALWYLLRRNGYAAELVLGARTLMGPFEAHAWVELDGVALNDSGRVRDIYASFELPATGTRPSR